MEDDFCMATIKQSEIEPQRTFSSSEGFHIDFSILEKLAKSRKFSEGKVELSLMDYVVQMKCTTKTVEISNPPQKARSSGAHRMEHYQLNLGEQTI